MRALIQVEFSDEDYEKVAAALRVLSGACDRYDVIIKDSRFKNTMRAVKGRMLFNLNKSKDE